MYKHSAVRISARFIYAVVALIVAMLSLATAASLPKGVLWKIQPQGVAPSYLLGTIHSEDERVINLPTKVRTLFEQADSFTAEIMMDSVGLLKMQQAMFIQQGDTLDKLISPTTFQQCQSLLGDYGMPASMIKQLKPWAAAVMLQMPKPKTGLFLDYLLFAEAQRANKKVYGLETADEQMHVFDDMPRDTQVAMLTKAIRQHDQTINMVEQLTRAYLSRDLNKIYALSEVELKKENKQVSDYVQSRLIVKRNRRMLQRMQARLAEGNAFIAVGALHLPGPQGLLRLLQQQGVKVSPLY